VTLAWAVTRRLPDAWHRQQLGTWNHQFEWLPFPQRAIVFGTGGIGRAIATLLNAEGIEVTGVKRTVEESSLPEFAHLYDQHSFFTALPRSDWCFLALPNTPETENLIDRKVLCSLPSHAVVVNVGRGQTLVTSDLCEVLATGHLGGAALDVIYPQPTDPKDPIWKTPRLIITPCVSARYKNRSLDEEKFCEAQLARFISGKLLLGLVDLNSFFKK
jgi:phosphoglycerate dehydrogenase-like enzyme